MLGYLEVESLLNLGDVAGEVHQDGLAAVVHQSDYRDEGQAIIYIELVLDAHVAHE